VVGGSDVVMQSACLPHWLGPLSATTEREQVQQFTVIFQLLDHLFDDDKQPWRDDEAECLGSCQV
jgi:hypothetical protein